MKTYTFQQGFKHIANIKANNINLACCYFYKNPDIKKDQRYYVHTDGHKYLVTFTRLSNWSWSHYIEEVL